MDLSPVLGGLTNLFDKQPQIKLLIFCQKNDTSMSRLEVFLSGKDRHNNEMNFLETYSIQTFVW